MKSRKSCCSRHGSCNKIMFVSRQDWRARLPVRTFPMALPVSDVIIFDTVFGECHNTAACIRNVQFLQDFHMDDKGWWDIAYSFLIGGDGRVYVGVGWHNAGEHTINYNTISIGVAFMGNFSSIAPSEQMIAAGKYLIDCGIEKGYLTPTVEVHGDRDVTCTESPGDRLYAIIKQWKNFKGGRMLYYNCRISTVDPRA
ncbi:peptidoglycan recognition protein-like isoform X2 [Stegodyphus dumicola]|uniref:peptidoglycan recognition protein-like isoform X2 n=1 Tax=Stegodyphus dumicola TaxID=202533 RepID=UPI0015B0F39C|nr:peptidoglycan recognition protein-like isoform X2 [Stegodyphus dumicola]